MAENPTGWLVLGNRVKPGLAVQEANRMQFRKVQETSGREVWQPMDCPGQTQQLGQLLSPLKL